MVLLVYKQDLADVCKVDGDDLLRRANEFAFTLPRERRLEFYRIVFRSFIFATDESPGNDLTYHPKYIERMISKLKEYS